MSRNSQAWKVPDDGQYLVSPVQVAIWLVESDDNAWVVSRLAGDPARMLIAHFTHELPIHVIADRFNHGQTNTKKQLTDTLDVLRAEARARPQMNEVIGHDAARWRKRYGSASAFDWVKPCPSCGNSLILWAPFGRPRRYCSDACRRRAHRLFANGKELTMLPVDQPPLWKGLARAVMAGDPSIILDVDRATARYFPTAWRSRI